MAAERTMVVKQNTKPETLAQRTVEQLNAGPVCWSVPKRHRRVARTAAALLTSTCSDSRVSAFHASPTEMIFLWSAAGSTIEGSVFAYWPPARGPQLAYPIAQDPDSGEWYQAGPPFEQS